MKRLIYSLAFVVGVAAAGTPAFAQQSGGLRVEFQGPGGHSSGAYGRVSALHAAARAVILIQQALPAGQLPDHEPDRRELGQFDRVRRSHRDEADRRKCRRIPERSWRP